jgi:aquacobalamin reductase/NAD(P)H-flavin reductase
MTISCKVKSIEPLACNTYKILLHPDSPVEFKAGQYLMVVMGEKDKRPFSIASSPCRNEGELELHIGAAEENAYASEVVEKMKLALAKDRSIVIDAPHGDAWLQDSERPIILIAGGTGFSYVRSILDHCVSQKIDKPIYLYWGARSDIQLYAFEEMEVLSKKYSNIHFIPVVESAPNIWNGKVGNVLSAVKADFDSLADFDIYIAGRFEMAGAAREEFSLEREANRERIFGDAYSFI